MIKHLKNQWLDNKELLFIFFGGGGGGGGGEIA